MTKRTESFKDFSGALFIIIAGVLSVFFISSCIKTAKIGFVKDHAVLLQNCLTCFITAVSLFAFVFLRKTDAFLHKISLLLVFICFFMGFILYFYPKSGLIDKIDSVEDFRKYIETFGGYAAIIYIVFQFLQVVIIPLPSVIIIGAGVLLFGPLKCAIYSYIGIILGSLAAFFSGRHFGAKFVKWLLGEKTLEKGLNLIKGKDKILLTFMFLFPFFPDDALCFISGITKIKTKFFVLMIIIVRCVTVFIAAFSINNSLIPFDKKWGIFIWIIFFILTVILTAVIYKKGDKIEKCLSRKKKNT